VSFSQFITIPIRYLRRRILQKKKKKKKIIRIRNKFQNDGVPKQDFERLRLGAPSLADTQNTTLFFGEARK